MIKYPLPIKIFNINVLDLLGDRSPGRRFDSITAMEDYIVSEFCEYICSHTIDCNINHIIDDDGNFTGKSRYIPVQKIDGDSDCVFLFPDRLRYFIQDRQIGTLWAKVQDDEYAELSFGPFTDNVHPEDLYAKECYLRNVYITNFDKIADCVGNHPLISEISIDSEQYTIKYRLSGRLSENRG